LSPEWWAWEAEEQQRRECREKVSSEIQRKTSTRKIEPEQERCEPWKNTKDSSMCFYEFENQKKILKLNFSLNKSGKWLAL
jgi:predicted kinase